MASAATTFEQHPDLIALRQRYERAGSTPMAQAADGLTFLTGLYLAVSPWVVGFNSSRTLTANDLIVGVALVTLALGFASAYGRTHGIAWVAPLIGVWAIISPWVVSGAPTSLGPVLSNVITGAVAIVLAVAVMAAARGGSAGTPAAARSAHSVGE